MVRRGIAFEAARPRGDTYRSLYPVGDTSRPYVILRAFARALGYESDHEYLVALDAHPDEVKAAIYALAGEVLPS